MARRIRFHLDRWAITLIVGAAVGLAGWRWLAEHPEHNPFAPLRIGDPIGWATGRKLAVVWGVHCVVTEDAHDVDDMVDRACRIAHEESFGKEGDRIIITAGVPLRTPGSTNMLRIANIEGGVKPAKA